MTTRAQGNSRKGSSGNGLAGELESFVAGWTADRIRSIGDRAKDARDHRGDDGDEDGNGGDRGGVLQDVMRSGFDELRSGGSPLGAAAKAATTGVTSKVKNAFRGKGGSGSAKVINIVEDLDVGVPVEVAWKEWNNFRRFNTYMKGVDSAERVGEDKVNFRAKVAWSHRSWESTITDEVENERLAWKSKGSKGSVDGVVTFHELGPNLTKMLLVLEYHPAGFFEKTGNLWRAQGRRARLDFKHFRRHVMSKYAQGDEESDDEREDEDERSGESGREGGERDDRNGRDERDDGDEGGRRTERSRARSNGNDDQDEDTEGGGQRRERSRSRARSNGDEDDDSDDR